MRSDEWKKLANCRGMDVNLFFPGLGENSNCEKKIKPICSNCLVQQECLEYGMSEEVGYYGGVSAIRRIRMVRAMRREERQREGVK